jgi:hypothetical protein
MYAFNDNLDDLLFAMLLVCTLISVSVVGSLWKMKAAQKEALKCYSAEQEVYACDNCVPN